MAKRIDAYTSRLEVDPRDQAIVTFGSVPGNILERERTIIRSLDGLLMRVGTRAVQPDETRAILAAILQEVLDLGRKEAEGGAQGRRDR
jgi:hypothetical protein